MLWQDTASSPCTIDLLRHGVHLLEWAIILAHADAHSPDRSKSLQRNRRSGLLAVTLAKMRRSLLVFLLFNIALLGFLVHLVWPLLTLLVVDGRGDAILKSELPSSDSTLISTSPRIIPKIIHQTYKDVSIPAVWKEAQASCLALHPEKDGWKYILWTDAMSSDFIEQHYPEFVDTFEGYRYPIQRADAIRYFVLAHYGGIYVDLDDGCNRSLEPLLTYPAFVRRTIPTGISNDVMGAVPGHPFFVRTTEVIAQYDRSWILGYITVMASTGPLFLSVLWVHWLGGSQNVGDGQDGGRVRIIFPDEYEGKDWSFWIHHLGNSWHGKDVEFIFWVRQHHMHTSWY